MQELKVIGIENGALLAAADSGERFRIEIDEVMRSRLRRAQPDATTTTKLSPREIQAQIRAGLSAEDVASATGVSLEDVQRFERPVLAEREHVVNSALAVPVQLANDVDPAQDPVPFGTAIRERLSELTASGERWASWKDAERGWIVKVEFTADGIDHDARWCFDLRKQSLQPMNSEAITLSQQGEIKGGLIPRLRAVGIRTDTDDSRFDSGAFALAAEETENADGDTAPHGDGAPYARTVNPPTSGVTDAAINRDTTPKKPQDETADLLEALRRRRGEREKVPPAPPASENSAPPVQQQATQPTSTPGTDAPTVALIGQPVAEANAPTRGDTVDTPLMTFDDLTEKPAAEKPGTGARSIWGEKRVSDQGDRQANRAAARKGRPSMPSWDEIVFGARSDDDPA